MTENVTVLPAPEGAEEAVRSVTGEVIEPMDTLREHEKNIRKNFARFEKVQQSVARSLNVIYHNELWKLHKTADGKRRYTNFNDYLATEFGWDKTAARARQIMKADVEAAIEAGEIPADVGDKRRTRTAPEVTAEKAAKVTVKQLETVLDALTTRLGTVEPGGNYARLEEIVNTGADAIGTFIDALNALIEDLAAEAEVDAEVDDTDSDAEKALEAAY
jgi:hypothetical protein